MGAGASGIITIIVVTLAEHIENSGHRVDADQRFVIMYRNKHAMERRNYVRLVAGRIKVKIFRFHCRVILYDGTDPHRLLEGSTPGYYLTGVFICVL